MLPETRLSVTAAVFNEATPAQMQAMHENICAEGSWEHTTPNLIFMDHGTLFVRFPSILIGIEKDGYTHS